MPRWLIGCNLKICVDKKIVVSLKTPFIYSNVRDLRVIDPKLTFKQQIEIVRKKGFKKLDFIMSIL